MYTNRITPHCIRFVIIIQSGKRVETTFSSSSAVIRLVTAATVLSLNHATVHRVYAATPLICQGPTKHASLAKRNTKHTVGNWKPVPMPCRRQTESRERCTWAPSCQELYTCPPHLPLGVNCEVNKTERRVVEVRLYTTNSSSVFFFTSLLSLFWMCAPFRISI